MGFFGAAADGVTLKAATVNAAPTPAMASERMIMEVLLKR
jgi:hypothetical protein